MMSVEIKGSESFRNNTNASVQRTSSFKDRIEQNRSETPGGNEIEDILRRQAVSTDSPRRGRRRNDSRTFNAYSPTRDSSKSPMRRERSYLRSTSPDKLPFRKPTLWAQWDVPEKERSTTQDYNIKQMTGLYGKNLRGKVDAASEWYQANGLNRSKTQTEALSWLSQVVTYLLG